MCVCVCLGLHYLCYQADRASPRADRVLGNASQRARGEPVLCSGETNNILVIFERLRYEHNPREFEFYGCKCLRESFVKPLKETLKLIMSRQVSKKGQNVFCVFRHDAIPLIFAIIITFKSRRISLVAKTSNVWCTSELLPFLEKKKRCVNVCKPARPEEKPSQLLWVWTNRIQWRKTSHSCLDGLFFFGPRDNTPHTMTWKHGCEEKHHCVVDRLVSFEARKGAHTRETPRLTPTGCTLRLIDVQEKQEPLKGPDRFLLRSSAVI